MCVRAVRHRLAQLTPHSLDHRALPRVRDLASPRVGRQLERGEGRGENGEHRVRR